jgi:SNF2 family DNA or RNA helicase
MKIEFLSQAGHFADEDHKVLFAKDLLEIQNQMDVSFPNIEFSQSYWDVGFEYQYLDEGSDKVDVLLVLSNRGEIFKLVPPTNLEADYFFFDNRVCPIRLHDYESLHLFLPNIDLDDKPGFSVKELMNFDYFASSNRFIVTNQEFKDRVLSNPKIDLNEFKNLLKVAPYPYQAVGIEWLKSQQSLGRRGVILADVMGLGKTLQAIGLITNNVASGHINNLVICPGTLIANWVKEIEKFSPDLQVLVHSGGNRSGTAAKILGYDVVLTSYDTLIQDHALLSSIHWNLVVADEAQALKNPRAKRTIRCKGLPRNFGLAISGTPLENRLLDLWSLSDFAEPGIFGSETQFVNEYEEVSGGAIEVNRVIRPILLRRRLHEIEHQLPEKIVQDHPLEWPLELNDVYERVRLEAIREFAMAGGLVATGRLRKLTTHPVLMEIGPEDLTVLSPKYVLTLDLVSELLENNEKCLIFASYREIIERITLDLGVRFPNSFIKSLDGGTKMDERNPLVEEFNDFKGSGVLVCNPIVAGAGLNITGANHVIHYNLEWNPAKEDQATFRVYRNGQSKVTFIHRLFYLDTIDEVIDDRLQIKRALSDLSVDAAVNSDDYLAGLQASPFKLKDD